MQELYLKAQESVDALATELTSHLSQQQDVDEVVYHQQAQHEHDMAEMRQVAAALEGAQKQVSCTACQHA